MAVLGRLLQRCVSVMPSDAPPHSPAAIIATHALRTLAGMAAFPTARAQLLARLVQALNAGPADGLPRPSGLGKTVKAARSGTYKIWMRCNYLPTTELIW